MRVVATGRSLFSARRVVGADWPIVLPRYLYPVLPALVLLAGFSWWRLARSERTPLALSTMATLCLSVAWIYLAGRYGARHSSYDSPRADSLGHRPGERTNVAGRFQRQAAA